jgi:putative transposase
MSEKTSLSTHLKYGVEMVCKAWRFPRSSFYHAQKCSKKTKGNRGKKSIISDNVLLKAIKNDIEKSPFRGEGHRKIHARLKRSKHLNIGRNRVLKLMREHRLLSPYRSEQSLGNPHDGRITTDSPNEMWGTDAAKIFTLEDGWVWFFGVIDHWNAECLGWHVTKKGDRFAAIEALNQAVEKVYGAASAEVARGLKLRIDHGSQFVSDGFTHQARYWGISISKGFVREPETNGVIERFHRTLKEQIVYGRQYHSLEDFRRAVEEFIRLYNEQWLLEKLGYHSPHEARELYLRGKNVVKAESIISTALPEQGEEHGYFCLAAKDSLNEKEEFHRVPSQRKGARLLLSGEIRVANNEILENVQFVNK